MCEKVLKILLKCNWEGALNAHPGGAHLPHSAAATGRTSLHLQRALSRQVRRMPAQAWESYPDTLHYMGTPATAWAAAFKHDTAEVGMLDMDLGRSSAMTGSLGVLVGGRGTRNELGAHLSSTSPT